MTVNKLSLASTFFAAAGMLCLQTMSAQSPAPASSVTTTQTVTTTTVATSSSTNAPAAVPIPTVQRTIRAMHYRLQGGQTRVDFRGTSDLQSASGEAKVEGKKTNFEIEAKFEGMQDATRFGFEYLTYVPWGETAQRT